MSECGIIWIVTKVESGVIYMEKVYLNLMQFFEGETELTPTLIEVVNK